MIAAWGHGGVGMWSTFGALLMCSLGWDYGLNVDLQKCNPLHITSMVSLKFVMIHFNNKTICCRNGQQKAINCGWSTRNTKILT